MKKLFILLFIVTLILAGCSGEEPVLPVENGEEEESPVEELGSEIPSTTIVYGPVLTAEREAEIRDYAAKFEGMFKIYTIIERDDALEIWLDVGPEPITDDAVKGLTEGLLRDFVGLFNEELSLRLTALQENGNGDFNLFGTSIFIAETGEFLYEPL